MGGGGFFFVNPGIIEYIYIYIYIYVVQLQYWYLSFARTLEVVKASGDPHSRPAARDNGKCNGHQHHSPQLYYSLVTHRAAGNDRTLLLVSCILR